MFSGIPSSVVAKSVPWSRFHPRRKYWFAFPPPACCVTTMPGIVSKISPRRSKGRARISSPLAVFCDAAVVSPVRSARFPVMTVSSRVEASCDPGVAGGGAPNAVEAKPAASVRARLTRRSFFMVPFVRLGFQIRAAQKSHTLGATVSRPPSLQTGGWARVIIGSLPESMTDSPVQMTVAQPGGKPAAARLSEQPQVSWTGVVCYGLCSVWQALQLTASLYLAIASGAPFTAPSAEARSVSVLFFQSAASPLGASVPMSFL